MEFNSGFKGLKYVSYFLCCLNLKLNRNTISSIISTVGRQYIGLFLWSKFAVLLLCCTVQLSVRYATVMVYIKVNTYLSAAIKMWMFRTAQVQGVS